LVFGLQLRDPQLVTAVQKKGITLLIRLYENRLRYSCSREFYGQFLFTTLTPIYRFKVERRLIVLPIKNCFPDLF
jgi:hypothetical protein